MAKENTKPDTNRFRDKLSTVSNEGKRLWIYARKPKGKFTTQRRILAYILLLIFYAGPFIKIGDEPIMLFDILQRKFVIFGIVFWPQDFHLILLTVITSIVFIVLFTVIFGRLFCGWICPQTVFMEFVFRHIEWAIEGNPAAQRKLNEQAMNFEKLWKKTLKHTIFFAIAIITSITFLSYVIGVDSVFDMLALGPITNFGSYAGLLIFSGAFYFVFAFFREQVCTIACPYGRLQGVLVDKKTVLVGYDYKRGEPRGPLNKDGSVDNGDCIDCGACITVCPTGIDIRNGTQLECINCTACIDACDTVMDRVKKPRGLIRYDSEEGLETGQHNIFNTRSIAYSTVLFLLLVFVGYLFVLRGDFESTILRARGSLFQEYGTDSISNIYNYNLVNKSSEPLILDYKVESHNARIKHIQGYEPVQVGEVGKGTFLIVFDKDDIKSSKTPIIIGLYRDGELVDTYNTTFVGPNTLN